MVNTQRLKAEKNYYQTQVLEVLSFHTTPYTQAWNLVNSSHTFKTKLDDNSKFFIIKAVQ